MAKRTIETHKTNVVNEHITIEVMDEPGSGGANHHYRLSGFNSVTNPSDPYVDCPRSPEQYETILFQNGPIKEVGVNGITNEVLLAVLIDRLEGFQRGPFACEANKRALEHIRTALSLLMARTREREARGVEGTLVV